MHNPNIKINDYCYISDSELYFKLQDGPIKENGKNGAQIDDLVLMSKKIIEYFNEKFPCRENSVVITKLDEALLWMLKRTMDRNSRNVEGLDKK